MSAYRRPLVHGGSRIIPRTGGGQFARASVDCTVCPRCGSLNFPTFIDDRPVGGFVRKVYPRDCRTCFSSLSDTAKEEGA